MFKKLLKYDFKAIAKSAIPLSIAALAGSVIGGISTNLLDHGALKNSPFQGLLAIAYALGIMVIVAAVLGIHILVYSYFYKNLFTDEGYLTFTLPAKRSSVLLSKTLNAFIWIVLAGVLAAVLSVVLSILAGGFKEIVSVLRAIFSIFQINSFEEAMWLTIFLIEGILLAIATTAMQINLIQFCITFGATLAKKHKLLAAFGIYYAVNAVLSFSGQILIISFAQVITKSLVNLSDFNTTIFLSITALTLLAVFLIVAGITVGFYVLSLRRIKKNLNIS